MKQLTINRKKRMFLEKVKVAFTHGYSLFKKFTVQNYVQIVNVFCLNNKL